MSTIINTPGVDSRETSGVAFLIGIVALIVFGGLFLVYVMPEILTSMRSANPDTTIEVQLPPAPTAVIE